MDSLIPQIVENFKVSCGLKITDSSDTLLTERNLLEFLMKLGRGVMGKVFEGMEKGYEGAVLRKERVSRCSDQSWRERPYQPGIISVGTAGQPNGVVGSVPAGHGGRRGSDASDEGQGGGGQQAHGTGASTGAL